MSKSYDFLVWMSSNNKKVLATRNGIYIFWTGEKRPITNSMWMNLKRGLLHETISFKRNFWMNYGWDAKVKKKTKKPRSCLKANDDAGSRFIWFLIDLTRDLRGGEVPSPLKKLVQIFVIYVLSVWCLINDHHRQTKRDR